MASFLKSLLVAVPERKADAYTPNLALKPPNGTYFPHISLYFIQILALLAPPFRGRREIFSGIIIALAVQAHLYPHWTNEVSQAQPCSIGWSYYMATLAKLLFSGDEGPEAHYWRIDKPVKEALSFAAFGWKKLVWSLMVVFNQRGVRWNHQVKNVPPVMEKRKARFLLLQAYQFLKCMLIADLLFELSTHWFFTSPDGQIGNMNSKYVTLRHQDWRWSFLKSLVFASTPYFMLSMQYAQFAFVAVLLGFSSPEVYHLPLCSKRESISKKRSRTGPLPLDASQKLRRYETFGGNTGISKSAMLVESIESL